MSFLILAALSVLLALSLSACAPGANPLENVPLEGGTVAGFWLGLWHGIIAPITFIDDVARDFPGLTVIMAHPAWPWVEEQIAVLLHKGNVYMDLSGWAPKYFPESLKREINGRLQDKVMFGSDYPDIAPKRWLDEFEAGGYKPEVMEKVLFKNAIQVLNLSTD
ncbi:MAG: amidohydrolase family protein [Chloroflexota bacterium]